MSRPGTTMRLLRTVLPLVAIASARVHPFNTTTPSYLQVHTGEAAYSVAVRMM